MATQLDKRDLPWAALIVLSFVIGLTFSWERWGNPLVDCGREMNQPLRLAQGEMLYSDVRHIYGPLSPYLNALLYKIFGPSLGVLYADGIVTAMVIIALVYWLARRLMGRAASSAAALSVMWLCAFKPAGNYVLPYSYSALHGCAIGLVSLALLVHFVERCGEDRSPSDEEGPDRRIAASPLRRVAALLVLAGSAAGLAFLAKTEMGLAALSAGLIAIALVGYPSVKRVSALGVLFIAPAAVLVLGVYGYITARVGWQTIANDSLVFLRNLPPELVYFNKRVSGFDQPLQSIGLMIGSGLRTLALAAIVATFSLLLTYRKTPRSPAHVPRAELSVSDAGQASYAQVWMMFVGSVLVFLLMPFSGALSWERGPYLAMPMLLALLLASALNRYRKQISRGVSTTRTVVFVVVAAYSLASLARVILRVRSGGAYSSYLLPASMIVFTYAWAHSFPGVFRDGKASRLVRNISIALLLADVAITASLLSYRYRDRNNYQLKTDRGTMIAVPDLGLSIREAIDFIKRETAEGDHVAVMPEGTSLNFFTNRPNPLREEITTPGYLDREGEERAIKQLIQSNTRFVLVANRATPEFSANAFGRDYCQTLMQWVDQNFEQVAIFGPDHNPNLEIGDKTFFIRAYRKRSTT